ncbi:MAG: RNA-binding protein domain [Dehalococcoidia bacterium]|nr:RNA-binding protein domain [Dehalococcoidia bacterium]
MKELVEYIVKSLVTKPDEVSVEVVPEGRRTVVRLYVAPSDMGKVIGKGGKVAQAIRNLLKVASTYEGSQAVLVIAPITEIDTDV